MKILVAVDKLNALAHETRLNIFRYLVTVGPEGSVVGDIKQKLDIPNATLSFHLTTLKHAELVYCQRQGRQLFYSANYEAMQKLLAYLTEDCCAGAVTKQRC